MTTRAFGVFLLICCLAALYGFSEIPVQRQSPTAVAPGSPASEPNVTARYQYFEGVVPKVFDTQTGRVYLWFPRAEREKTEPYLFVQDPVAGTGTKIPIRFGNQPSR